MYSNKCDLIELLPLYQISNEQKSVKKMHGSIDKKKTDVSSQTKFALQNATITPFNPDNHVTSLSCGNKSFHTVRHF